MNDKILNITNRLPISKQRLEHRGIKAHYFEDLESLNN